MAAAAEVPALAAEVADTFGRDCDIGRMALADFLIHIEARDEKAVRYVVGDEVKSYGLPGLERDLGWSEGKTVCVDLDGLCRLLGE
jgi:hypothetical protein